MSEDRCLMVKPGTFIVCGEMPGQFCSEECLIKDFRKRNGFRRCEGIANGSYCSREYGHVGEHHE